MSYPNEYLIFKTYCIILYKAACIQYNFHIFQYCKIFMRGVCILNQNIYDKLLHFSQQHSVETSFTDVNISALNMTCM